MTIQKQNMKDLLEASHDNLSEDELKTLEWLSSCERSSVLNIISALKAKEL